ncbi:UPF0104 family protein, partial [bacterium]|nr:UPF0104 family protein [bacterium]
MGGISAWWAFKGVPLSTLWHDAWHCPHPHWVWMGLGAALMTVGWRSWRWVWVMRQMAVQVPWQWALRALWIGQMTNALVPAKLGEAVKLGLLKRRGVPIGLGAILILVDRLLDGMS